MPSPSIPNPYPIELTPPDLSAYASGNTGIPYVWTFASGAPGPRVVVTAIVHGNEPCGAIALDWLMRRAFRPLSGRLTLAFANVAAYEAFDQADPYASRWVDEDFNRVWSDAVLDGGRDSVELRRARQIRPIIASADRLLDLHSMQSPAPPLALSGWPQQGRRLAREIGVPATIVADRGHRAGSRMRDYGAFGEEGAEPAALLVECGQHWQAAAADLAKAATARFLAATGLATPDFPAEAPWPAPAQTLLEVTEAVTVATDDFRFERPFTGGETLAAGDLIGRDGDREIRAPYGDCVLIMPTRRLWPGQTAVRLARRVG